MWNAWRCIVGGHWRRNFLDQCAREPLWRHSIVFESVQRLKDWMLLISVYVVSPVYIKCMHIVIAWNGNCWSYKNRVLLARVTGAKKNLLNEFATGLNFLFAHASSTELYSLLLSQLWKFFFETKIHANKILGYTCSIYILFLYLTKNIIKCCETLF